MMKKLTLLLVYALNTLLLFAASPQLIWHQTYGTSTDNQRVLVTAIDNYDNMFLAGFVYFNNYGNILINRYDGVGNLKWNRIYSNPQQSASADKPVALFPDNQAGVTVVGYINKHAVLTHIFSYDATGNLQADNLIGDTATGKKTIPIKIISDGASSFYMLGQLNSVPSVFKCDNSGHVIWSTPVPNRYNSQVGSICFDPFGNIVAGVYDSLLPQVIIHRYDKNSGSELPGFNSHVNSLPVNDNFIKILVDQGSNIFIAATGIDTGGRTQMVVDKFDTASNLLWSTKCNSAKGHTNIVNSFLLDHNGDILISGPFKDIADTLQYAGVYKIFNPTGAVLWSVIDSQFLVNEGVAQIDQYNMVYFGTTKTPSTISPFYSNFSFSQLTADSGIVQWNRSFDNSLDNAGLLMQVNNFGDVFFATNTPTDSSSQWFIGRVGNNAGDVLGTSIQAVSGMDDLEIFPNPFSTVTNLSLTSVQEEKLQLKIYDPTGRVLQEQAIQCREGKNQVEVKTSLAAGMYLLQLEGAGNSAVKRIVVY